MLVSVLFFLMSLGIYLLFAGQISLTEVVAGAATAAVVAAYSRLIRAASPHSFKFEAAAASASGRALAGVPLATAKLGAVLFDALFRTAHGKSLRRSFVHGSKADPTEAGRRAVSVLAASLAPDSYILRVPEGRDEVDLHALTATEPRDDARWPV